MTSVGRVMSGRQPRMSAEKVTRLKAIAVAGSRPPGRPLPPLTESDAVRQAGREHRDVLRDVASTSGTSMLAASATSSSDTPKP